MKEKKSRLRRYFMAECDCGWIVDGHGEKDRARIERARRKHAAQCRSATHFISERTWRFDPE